MRKKDTKFFKQIVDLRLDKSASAMLTEMKVAIEAARTLEEFKRLGKLKRTDKFFSTPEELEQFYIETSNRLRTILQMLERACLDTKKLMENTKRDIRGLERRVARES